ncbi:hypothetical protein B0H10DRAFT_2341430 [Mycena sp. CBHHK59/15]|nr:hypothetical protein B0H10DRAFT_2341430 [Mycena sp. CBHHK59/15]
MSRVASSTYMNTNYWDASPSGLLRNSMIQRHTSPLSTISPTYVATDFTSRSSSGWRANFYPPFSGNFSDVPRRNGSTSCSLSRTQKTPRSNTLRGS